MSESAARKLDQDVDRDSLEETLRMPALEQMLADSEDTPDDPRQSPGAADQTLLMAQLARLVELSESIDGRLGQIADLLTRQSQPSRSAGPGKRKSGKGSKRSRATPG